MKTVDRLSKKVHICVCIYTCTHVANNFCLHFGLQELENCDYSR